MTSLTAKLFTFLCCDSQTLVNMSSDGSFEIEVQNCSEVSEESSDHGKSHCHSVKQQQIPRTMIRVVAQEHSRVGNVT